jgi:hypothetical protein
MYKDSKFPKPSGIHEIDKEKRTIIKKVCQDKKFPIVFANAILNFL